MRAMRAMKFGSNSKRIFVYSRNALFEDLLKLGTSTKIVAMKTEKKMSYSHSTALNPEFVRLT